MGFIGRVSILKTKAIGEITNGRLRPNTKWTRPDSSFPNLHPEEPAKGTEQPQDDEVDISEYLTGDDDELSQEQPAV